MLSDTIKRVNEAEQRAQEILDDAKTKAAVIVESARDQAKQNLSEAEAAAREEAKAALARAEKGSEEEKARFSSKVREQLEKDMQQALGKADVAVETLVAGLV